ncbi:TPA: restriction endonuclease subunit S [Escherichia coli]|nr:restriction endonuclease subunit S [Escherichia coli]HEI1573024.1 restriction endonuclease subunit S [Escherichia coli]
MSELSYLEKLLDGVEVKWLPLGNVAEIYGGLTGKSKSDFENGNARYVSYKKIFGYLDVNDYPTDYVYISEGERQNKVRYGDVLFTGSSEIADEAGMSSAVTVHFDESVYLNSFSFGIRFSNSIKIKPEFAKYLFRTHFMRSEIAKTASGVTRFNISKSRFKKILVPIICPNDPEKSLAIQSEIVRILDKFTALTAELTAELNMRKKQYNYYRDQLLSFKEGEVEWKSLEDIALFRRGSFPQPYGNSEWYDGEGCMPFVQVADVADSGFTLHTKTKQQISKIAQSKSVFVEAGTIVVTLQGTIGRVAITQYDCYVDRTLAIFTNFKVKINKKYFAYQLKAKFDSEKEFARGSTLKTITKEEFSKFQLPLPSINEQNRIVSLLDKFDTLAHSIKQGLPREIELRQKQYEYYRDLLFSFPKPETASN